MEKGKITRFLEKLHGFDAGITKIMVESWKNGRVKIDGVTLHVNVDLIAWVVEISLEESNFFRDKKMLTNVVKAFVKDKKEMKKIIKVETYYEMEPIKKLWRCVLRIIIEYISLDPRFDRIRMHHFVFLNHFRHGVKISFPFYIFTSMRKGIKGFKKKPTTNPTPHN